MGDTPLTPTEQFAAALDNIPAGNTAPLPATTVGEITDDAGTPVADNLGSPMVGSPTDAILNAIYAVAQEIRTLMATLSDRVAALTTTMEADNATMVTVLDAIKNEIVAGAVTDAQVTALEAAVTAQTANVTTAQGLVATPVVPAA